MTGEAQTYEFLGAVQDEQKEFGRILKVIMLVRSRFSPWRP
jgi:hypothetical protein